MNWPSLSGISSGRRILACKAAGKAKTVRKRSGKKAAAQSKAHVGPDPRWAVAGEQLGHTNLAQPHSASYLFTQHAKETFPEPTVHPSCHWYGPPRYLGGGKACGSCREGRETEKGEMEVPGNGEWSDEQPAAPQISSTKPFHTPLRPTHAPLLVDPSQPKLAPEPCDIPH